MRNESIEYYIYFCGHPKAIYTISKRAQESCNIKVPSLAPKRTRYYFAAVERNKPWSFERAKSV